MNPENQNTPTPQPVQPQPDILATGVSMEQNPAGQTPVPPATPELPKPKSKLIPILVIVLILVTLGAIGLWAYQNYFVQKVTPTPTPFVSPKPTATPDVTASWETFTNEKMNLSFRYPTTSGLQIFASQYNDYDISVNTTQYAPIYLEVAYLPNTELQDWYTKAYKSAQQDSPTPPALLEGPLIGGLKSYQSDFNLSGFGKIRYIFIPVSKGLYQIHMPITANEIQHQILSTFKFLGASPTPSATPQ